MRSNIKKTTITSVIVVAAAAAAEIEANQWGTRSLCVIFFIFIIYKNIQR
jgi:hypothetical protein